MVKKKISFQRRLDDFETEQNQVDGYNTQYAMHCIYLLYTTSIRYSHKTSHQGGDEQHFHFGMCG